MPSKSRKAAEVGVTGHECAAVLNRHSGMLGISNQLASGRSEPRHHALQALSAGQGQSQSLSWHCVQ